ncbi:hypothetical protein GOBAR_AA32372 [Gossypium barbadense]|uniref:Phorbol-ester/DAG-type domain-containing protein n=1 Tax=Gossypium barbadense TaxID=3634 RepID=A0A2P5WB63_GOSBA|nr:hypothetical protein GOBAR_AA32372 [Gossypium barbadense]
MQQIQHAFHEEHPLVLVAEQSNIEGLKAYCDGCGELLSAPCFTCIHCNYNLHKQCAEAPLSLPNHPLHPQHSYVGFFLRQRPYPSDHKKCLDELPTEIDHLTHRLHPLILNRSDSDYLCNPCQKKHSGPFYSCSLCHFNINVECAWPRSTVEDRSRHQHPFTLFWCLPEEFYEKSMQSSIIHVIEVNEAREATKIEHFSHQHCLVLAYKMEEKIDRKCDGCMLPISNIFYYCSECPFFLHKTCVELPRIKQHWFRQSNATLNFDSFKTCDFCDQYCSGFFYHVGYWDMCLRCAKVADIIECEGHQHFLFFDFKGSEKFCNGCGNRCSPGAFKCGKCKFALDFGCLTLPHSALHKIDEHMLNLTYHDDKEQSYCDICEQERDPSRWYNHDLKFYRKAEGYLECSFCGKLCQEEILKCEKPACNYIIHNECRWH